MHPLKPLLLVVSAAAVTAETDSACSPVSKIFVTVPASPTTETIYALNEGLVASALVNGAAQVTSTPITTTVTASEISTRVISVIQASSVAEDQAAYSFTEDNGTTTWLGATPPSSASLVTSTQVITLQPVPPGYVAPSAGITPVFTSFLTLSSTKTIIETYTETQTLTISTASASAGAYTGLASNGWNSSMSTFITVKSAALVAVAEKLAYHSGTGTGYPRAPSGVMPLSPGNRPRHVKARDVSDIVVATIDGVAVSWTYDYDGPSISSSITSPAIVPITATALQAEPTSTSFTVAAAIGPPPSCDEDASAAFIIDFDDLPRYRGGHGNTDIPPIFSPYHKLFFQAYFGYVPPPSDPFPPVSPPQLAVYRAEAAGASGAPNAPGMFRKEQALKTASKCLIARVFAPGGMLTFKILQLLLKGEIGSGPRGSDSAYWIDAYSAYLGCTNGGPDNCSIMVKGYQLSGPPSGSITQGFTLPPCPGLKNCSLALVEFAEGFRNLVGLQIIATVGSMPVDWYMDNLSLGWSNNTCAAQLERSSGQ